MRRTAADLFRLLPFSELSDQDAPRLVTMVLIRYFHYCTFHGTSATGRHQAFSGPSSKVVYQLLLGGMKRRLMRGTARLTRI